MQFLAARQFAHDCCLIDAFRFPVLDDRPRLFHLFVFGNVLLGAVELRRGLSLADPALARLQALVQLYFTECL